MEHQEIIDLWPDRQAFADAIDQKRNTVNKWYERNNIPSKHWKEIIAAARRTKRRLKLNDFLVE